jgi:hypothetical protein
MSAENQPVPVSWQQWPCGPECRHAQPMTGTYGEWLWCNHPQIGASVARAGLECIYYEDSTFRSAPTAPPGQTE